MIFDRLDFKLNLGGGLGATGYIGVAVAFCLALGLPGELMAPIVFAAAFIGGALGNAAWRGLPPR